MRQALNELKGKFVDIYTGHILFGDQHLQMQFDPETELGFGFRCRGQAIYIKEDEIVNCYAEEKEIFIESKLMYIKIVK